MTREEAQKILKIWMASGKSADGQRGYIEGWFDKDDVKAFRMAIEALEMQDLCAEMLESAKPVSCSEKPNDLISRQDAIEGVKELFACADIGNDECDITYMLENLPSADRPTGECRTCGRNADNGGVYEDGRTKCPIQEHYALLLDGYCHLYEPYDCGAKMVREDGEA